MKFLIDSATDKLPPFRGIEHKCRVAVVEIDTLDELLQLARNVGYPLIVDPNDSESPSVVPTITIYDGFLE